MKFRNPVKNNSKFNLFAYKLLGFTWERFRFIKRCLFKFYFSTKLKLFKVNQCYNLEKEVTH